MPLTLYINVETNRRIPKKLNTEQITLDNIDIYPHVVLIQLYIGQYSKKFSQVILKDTLNIMINHKDIKYCKEHCAKTKINNKVCEKNGVNPIDAIKKINNILLDTDIGYMVTYNMHIVTNLLFAEMIRYNKSVEPLINMPKVDLMKLHIPTWSLDHLYYILEKGRYEYDKTINIIIHCFIKINEII